MPSEKDKYSLKPSNYKINGNLLRAFYNKHGELVFVLDSTISKLKPNVLLVMNADGDRKWDDILSNDYHMDLELVRPKKDNKYQKLDVDYQGLDVYDNLINAYNDDGNVKKALKELEDFRNATIHRSTTERLAASKVIAENARETIERTNDTIVELKAKIKLLKTKLTGLRRGIGKEPTKQSAAKILKAEAQLDVLTNKLQRAKKRLENANKRLAIAEEDITIARKILALLPDIDDQPVKTVKAKSVPQKKKVVPVPVPDDDDDDVDDDDADDDEEETTEDDSWADDDTDESTDDNNDTDDDDDADDTDDNDDDDNNDVKPLFDKDPNIIDENIAFKPISFDETPLPQINDEPEKTDTPDTETDDLPTSFEPSKQAMDMVNLPDMYGENDTDVKLDDAFTGGTDSGVDYSTPEQGADSMLDSLKRIDDEEIHESETMPIPDDTLSTNEQELEPSVVENIDNDIPTQSNEPNTGINVTSVTEQPVNAPAPNMTDNLVRPVSPTTSPIMTNVKQDENKQHKPNLLYYVLLLVLIGLSVFTLWLYQRSNVSNDIVPVLVAEETSTQKQDTPQQPTPDYTDDENDENYNPFVGDGDDNAETVSITSIAENSLNKVTQLANKENAEPQPTVTAKVEQPDTEPDDDVTAPEETATDTDTDEQPVSTAPAPKATVVNKPEYNVTTQDVFVSENTADDTKNSLCNDGSAPDANGCCTGETYTDMGENGFNCCPDDGGDCFPPMF